MFQFKQIDSNIQLALFDRIDALNREKQFSPPLSPVAMRNESMEQMLTKSTWASVTSAVYDDDQKELVRMTSGITKDNQPIGSPITSMDDFENPKGTDLHRPHSGIQSISTSFKTHSIQNVTINWKFWDIREFEKYKEAFLKHGRMVMVEFGWAKNKKISLEHQTVTKPDEMLSVYEALQEQISSAGGDYYAAIGQIKNYSYKINPAGGFDCTTELISMGSTMFKGQIDPAPDSKLPEAIIENNDKKEQDVMQNSNFYFEKFIENLDEHIRIAANDRKQAGVYHNGEKENGGWCNWGWFEDIVLNTFFGFTTQMGEGTTPLKTSIESRDIKYEIDSKSKVISTTPSETLCRNSKNLYSNTKDILFPGQIGGILDTVGINNALTSEATKKVYGKLFEDFTVLNDKEKMPLFATDAVVKTSGPGGEEIYKNSKGLWMYDVPGGVMIVPPPAEVPATRGTIRHMVFSSKFLKDSFSGGVRDLGGAVTSFFNRVSAQYGGYWNFDVVNSINNTGQIGVIDKFTTENRVQDVNPDGLFSDKSTRDKLGTFVFSNYGKNSLMKDFDLEVKLTAAQATMAVYHTNKDAAGKPGGTNKPEDKGIRALAILQNVQITEQKDKVEADAKEDQIISKITFPFLENHIMAYESPSDQHSPLVMKPVGKSEKQAKGDVDKIIQKNEQVTLSEKLISEEGKTYRAFTKDKSDNITNLIFDPKGNMYQGFNRLMLHTLNNSQESQKEVDPLVPIGVTFSIPGIGGIQMYDLFTVDYLPETYKNFAVFQATTIDHTLDTTGWTTSISGQMRIDMLSLTEAHGKLFTPKVIEIIEETDAKFAETQIKAQEILDAEDESSGKSASTSSNNSAVVSEVGVQAEVSEADWQAKNLDAKNNGLKIISNATAIYNSMNGIGTAESKFKEVYKHHEKAWSLNHDNQVAIQAAFWDISGNGIVNMAQRGSTGTNEDLAWWIDGEFGGEAKKEAFILAGYPSAYKIP